MSPNPDDTERTNPRDQGDTAGKCPFCMRDMPETMGDTDGYDTLLSALADGIELMCAMRRLVTSMKEADDD